MTSTLDSSVTQTPINFQEPNHRQRARTHWGWDDENSFGIWSCRFSADGNEVVAGGSGQIFGRLYFILELGFLIDAPPQFMISWLTVGQSRLLHTKTT